MKYIDLHCDTLMMFAGEQGNLYENTMAVDFTRLKKGNCLAQFFAVWMPDEEGLQEFKKAGLCGALSGELSREEWDDAYIGRLLSCLKDACREHERETALALNWEDLKKNGEAGRMSAFLTLEDGRAVRGSLERLKAFYDQGIRLITLTWNADNCFGRANYRDETPGSRESGLTDFGREAVRYMNELGMIVDASHLSDEGFYDVAAVSRRPFVASHSNARALADCSRNLSDDMIRLLAEKGGVTGLNFAPGFLEEDFYSKESRIERMSAHAKYIVNCGGEEVLALGSDLDGVGGRLEIASPDQMWRLWEALKGAGFTERQIELAARGNAERVIKDVLK
ncbi:MAG: membrane dipeptidase [Lachnospiraceae bacterium]|jgi:membrane dipeptidase|nr:membrane dipeptidase [Lachnospiraceae bacterium]